MHLMRREAPPQTVINDRFEIFSDHETFFSYYRSKKGFSLVKKIRFFKICMVVISLKEYLRSIKLNRESVSILFQSHWFLDINDTQERYGRTSRKNQVWLPATIAFLSPRCYTFFSSLSQEFYTAHNKNYLLHSCLFFNLV